jgi:hypothetical protein
VRRTHHHHHHHHQITKLSHSINAIGPMRRTHAYPHEWKALQQGR